MLSGLAQSNHDELVKGITIMFEMPQEIYSQGPGSHFRHVADFYRSLIYSENGLVNLSDRIRNTSMEQDKYEGISSYQKLLVDYDRFIEDHYATARTPLMVKDQVGDKVEHIAHTLDSFLHFLGSHVTHHWWIIREKSRELGHIIDDETFGVSSSTLEYRKKCAR